MGIYIGFKKPLPELISVSNGLLPRVWRPTGCQIKIPAAIQDLLSRICKHDVRCLLAASETRAYGGASDMASFHFSQHLCMCIFAQLSVPHKSRASCCLADYGEIKRREEKQAFCTLLKFFWGEVNGNTSMTVTSGL